MLLNKIIAVSLFPVAALAAQGTPIQPVQPMQREPLPTIASSASADARFTPDRATVSIAVQTRASTASAAAAENATKQNAVLSSLRALGMTNDQLSTTGYSVNPEYRYSPNNTPTLTGYTVTNTVLADVHDLRQIGKVLDTALANGSNVISSLDFYASNTDSARQLALADAVAKARAEADIAAKAAGGTLGALIHLSIGGGSSSPPPRPMFMAKAAIAGAQDTQINPGQQTVTVSASGDWRFIPNH
ncbi:MAG: SIMPL domain-containing protein [Gemmatimonadaceae bacterium]